MNLRLLCKFQVARVEKALAARLNKTSVDLLSVNTTDRSKYTWLELKVLPEFVALARAVLFAPAITIEQINNLVSQASRLIELLVRPRRTVPVAKTRQRNFDWFDAVDDDFVLGRVGVRTGSAENMIGLHMRS